jgi:hypothetical protein
MKAFTMLIYLSVGKKRNYGEDMDQLDGKVPIWCFTPASGDNFVLSDFADGSLFHRYQCEMSLNGYLSRFPMIELEVPANLLKSGLTHNAYSVAKVFPYISKEMLVAIYRLSYDQHYFYPKVLLVTEYSEDHLFPNGYQCSKPLKGNNPTEK